MPIASEEMIVEHVGQDSAESLILRAVSLKATTKDRVCICEAINLQVTSHPAPEILRQIGAFSRRDEIGQQIANPKCRSRLRQEEVGEPVHGRSIGTFQLESRIGREQAAVMKQVLTMVVVLIVAILSTEMTVAQEASSGRENLLVNGAFEKGTNGWELHAFASHGKMSLDETEKHAGKPSLRIDNPVGDDSFVKQKVKVKPDTRYRLTGFIKTKDVQAVKRDDKNGACLAVGGGYQKTPSVLGSKTWARVSFEFTTGKETEIEVGPRLGFYSAMVLGTAWYSDLSLVEIGRARK
jgi:hypothetical protein